MLAILRERLGHLTQKELAAYAGTSTWTIQAIELEKLQLSQSLAFRISQATGVDYGWLTKNDLSRPPVNQRNEPYSEEDLIRAQNRSPEPTWFSLLNGKMVLTYAYYYLHLAWKQSAKDPDELFRFFFRLKQFLEDTGKFEEVPLLRDPSPFPLTSKIFEVVERDVYECKEAFKKHIAPLVSHPKQEPGSLTLGEEIAKLQENPSLPATKAVTAKRSKAQAKVHRASK